MELLLVRHAEPVRVEPGGGAPADPGLTELGHEQARRLAAWLVHERIDHVVTSPLRRSRETAAPVAAAHGLEPEVVEGLTEYDARADFYIPIEELRRTRDDRWTAMLEGRWEVFGGSDPESFRRRVVPAVEELVERFPGGRVAVVCHGGVINVYAAHVLDLDRFLWFEPAYTSVTRIVASRSGPRSLASLNETGHLLGDRDEQRAVESR